MVKHKLRVVSYELLVTSWKLKSTSWNWKVRVQIHELRVKLYELRVQTHEFRVQSTSYKFKYTTHVFKSTSYEFKSTSYVSKFTSSRIVSSMKTRVNSLKICSFPKILSLKSFSNSWIVRSISGDNFVFYFSAISWLRLQQETMWVNINSERRDLTSTQKRHSSPDEFGENYLHLI